MKKTVALLSLAAVCFVGTAFAQGDNDGYGRQGEIKRVLLISIDGMHAVDFANCAHGIGTANNGEPYCPALAGLAKTGINYVAANTSRPSDSFPGLTAIVTGGSPALTGVYYDVASIRGTLTLPQQPPATVLQPALALQTLPRPAPPRNTRKALTESSQ
jgi:predicted AlkP superfamily pyrophosphatase or phosphodiesterase